MEEFFFVPMSGVALAALIIFAAVMGWLAILARRNRVMFRLGVRNAGRRPMQTALIVLGLMLSTLVIGGAFGIGDTITHTMETMVSRNLGHTDGSISVQASGDNASPSTQFDYSEFERLRAELSAYDKVDGLAPVISGSVLVVNKTTEQHKRDVTLFAPDPQHLSGFGQITTEAGEPVSLLDLGPDEVYLDRNAADDLNADQQHELCVFLQPGKSTCVRMKAIVANTSAGASPAILMPLSRAQDLLGWEGKINAVYISNRGGLLDGVKYTDEVEAEVRPLLAGTSLEFKTDKTKAERLDAANFMGSVFTSILVVLGLFSIAAGLLLIFLIFTMLAADRKQDMGIARAVGTRRSHLIQMFVFEGLAYSLGAALVGVLLGMAVTYALAGIIVDIMARARPDVTFQLAYHFEPSSMVVAFILGVMVTIVTVALSSWGVGRLNVVSAIRDIPEPGVARQGYLRPSAAMLLAFWGLILIAVGFSMHRGSPVYLGVAVGFASAALLASWLGLRASIAYTVGGVAILAWSVIFMGAPELTPGTVDTGLEMFFFSGIMMVLGAIWVVTHNLSPLLRGLTVLLGRLRRMAPAVKTAVAHVSSSRLRTGLIIGMFSLVVFTLTFMSVAIGASAPQYDDPLTAAGGYDILGTVSSQNPLDDINGLIEEAPSLDPSDFLFIGGYSTLSEFNRTVGVRQADVESREWHDYPVRGADEEFLETNNFEFIIMATEYGSAREVWQAVKENPGYAVIAADAVPTRSEEASGLSEQGFNLEGLHRDADSMPALKVELRDADRPLTLIGVLEPSELSHGVYTSRATLEEHLGLTTRPTTYLFKLADGVDPEATAAAMEAEFFNYGMEADSIASLLEKRSAIYFAVLSLLQAFVALGLVVGIAAIGVVSVRAVIERRHEIGVLRAIGYRRGTVQLSFMIESSIVAVLGILIGTTLALLLSYYIVSYMQGQGETATFEIPWLRTLAISAGIWAGSILMTALPSRQASKIYPAEALRYE